MAARIIPQPANSRSESFSCIRTMRQGKRIVMADNQKVIPMQTPLLQSIAYGILWQQWLDEGRYDGVGELAKAVGKDRAIVSHTLQLALLSPEIIHMAIVGTLPPHISFKTFFLPTGPNRSGFWGFCKGFWRVIGYTVGWRAFCVTAH